MWEINSSFQAVSFLYSVLFGVLYCLFYDFFRVLRKLNKSTELSVFFEDLFYFVVIAFVTFLLLMSLSNGEIRGYILFGMAVGFVICYFTISQIHETIRSVASKIAIFFALLPIVSSRFLSASKASISFIRRSPVKSFSSIRIAASFLTRPIAL